jgi:hypothetical protein
VTCDMRQTVTLKRAQENLILGHWLQVKLFVRLSSRHLRFSLSCVDWRYERES